MTVDQIYQIMQLIFAKNSQQGYISPEDFNNAINQGQRQYFDYLLGEYQKYQVRRPIPLVAFGQNERIRDSIAPLIYNIELPVDPTTGIASYPSDYEYVDAMWSIYGLYGNIKFIQQDRLAAYRNSTIDPIATNPVYLLRHEGFEFYPHTIGRSKMSYVRVPPPIHWGYDLDGNGIPVYNSALSQQPIWSDSDIFQIIVRACSIESVSMQLNNVLGYAEQIKNNGQ